MADPEKTGSEAMVHEGAAARRQRSEIRNINEMLAEHLTPGQRAADRVARHMGSWRFILVQAGLLVAWIVVNSLAWRHNWDPYPFILLNLMLSFQAAFAAPVIMMSQNRQAIRDRLNAEQDYAVNRLAELEVVAVQEQLDRLVGRQWETLVALQRDQLEMLHRIGAGTRRSPYDDGSLPLIDMPAQKASGSCTEDGCHLTAHPEDPKRQFLAGIYRITRSAGWSGPRCVGDDNRLAGSGVIETSRGEHRLSVTDALLKSCVPISGRSGAACIR